MLTEGERWTRGALEELRASGDWTRFLIDAHARARETAAARPELAAQARRWGAAGLAASLAARRGARWWCACWLMLWWHLGMVETEDGRPRPLGAADALTLARAWIVPFVWERPAPALVLAAGVTDVLDGVAARAAEPTRFGRDLEGVVDVAFSAAALRGAVRQGWVPGRVAAAETARLAAGVAWSTGIWFGRARPPGRGPARLARALAPFRFAALVWVGVRAAR